MHEPSRNRVLATFPIECIGLVPSAYQVISITVFIVFRGSAHDEIFAEVPWIPGIGVAVFRAVLLVLLTLDEIMIFWKEKEEKKNEEIF